MPRCIVYSSAIRWPVDVTPENTENIWVFSVYFVVPDMNGTYLRGTIIDVEWVHPKGHKRHVVCAVTHQARRQAHLEEQVVLLRNAWWFTQTTLTHPTFELRQVPFVSDMS